MVMMIKILAVNSGRSTHNVETAVDRNTPVSDEAAANENFEWFSPLRPKAVGSATSNLMVLRRSQQRFSSNTTFSLLYWGNRWI